jgi:RP/EB family microtubule-associated protein
MAMRRIKFKTPGRLELLAWLNKLMQTDYAKVEQLCDGVAYLQIFDAVLPNAVPLHRVRFDARSKFDCLHNLSILEGVMRRSDAVSDHTLQSFDKERNARGCFQDTFEFLQWCYEFQRGHPDAVQGYNGYARRIEAMERANGAKRPHTETRGRNQTSPRDMMRMHEVDQGLRAQAEQTLEDAREAAEDNRRTAELQELVRSLEVELTSRILAQHAMTQEILAASVERDRLFQKLASVERACLAARSGQHGGRLAGGKVGGGAKVSSVLLDILYGKSGDSFGSSPRSAVLADTSPVGLASRTSPHGLAAATLPRPSRPSPPPPGLFSNLNTELSHD